MPEAEAWELEGAALRLGRRQGLRVPHLPNRDVHQDVVYVQLSLPGLYGLQREVCSGGEEVVSEVGGPVGLLSMRG